MNKNFIASVFWLIILSLFPNGAQALEWLQKLTIDNVSFDVSDEDAYDEYSEYCDEEFELIENCKITFQIGKAANAEQAQESEGSWLLIDCLYPDGKTMYSYALTKKDLRMAYEQNADRYSLIPEMKMAYRDVYVLGGGKNCIFGVSISGFKHDDKVPNFSPVRIDLSLYSNAKETIFDASAPYSEDVWRKLVNYIKLYNNLQF